MNSEKMKHHIDALREKHAKIDAQIDLMEAAGHFTPAIEADLHHFKKKRLELRDEIAQCEAKLG